jgi:hypothetical protein
MEITVTFEELIKSATESNLYIKLIQQLNKDLLLANSHLQFDEEVLPSSLKFLLHQEIYKLLQDSFSDYLNLLYIIDVSETKIRQLDENDVLELSEQVTLLILKREWQKVWFRYRY